MTSQNLSPDVPVSKSPKMRDSHLQLLKLEKSVFKNTDTYKDQNIETEQVWLD